MGDRWSQNHKNIVFLSNTGPDPLKNHNATKPAFNDGPSSACQCDTILMMAHFKWYFDPLSPHQKKVRVRPHLTKLSGSAHGKLTN